MTPGVSLRQHGLTAPDGLDCIEGGLHHVQESAVIMAAVAGGGNPQCLKCGEVVRLVPIEHHEDSAR
jgi:hypothetical protein